jgi:hypothetical protein
MRKEPFPYIQEGDGDYGDEEELYVNDVRSKLGSQETS